MSEMDLKLKNIIIHQVQKEKGAGPVTLKLGDKVLPVNDKAVNFIKDVHTAYNRRGSRQYGVFNDNIEIFRFQVWLNQYLGRKEDFVKFTHRAMASYQENIKKATLATGAYVILAHYFEKMDRFLIVMLNDTNGYAINDSLDIDGVMHLNLSHMDLATRIDLDFWASKDDSYLSFIKGNKDVSEYFLNFIGCTSKVSPKKTTDHLIDVMLEYLDSQNVDVNEKARIRNDVYAYCDGKSKKDEEVSMMAISNIICPDNPKVFYEHATSDKIRLNDSFYVDHQALRQLKVVVYRSSKLSIKFPEEEINKTIFYDESSNNLVIKNIDDALVRQLRRRT